MSHHRRTSGRWGSSGGRQSRMAWYGIQKLTMGTNQQPTPHPGECVAPNPRARAAEAARNCQINAKTSAAIAARLKITVRGLAVAWSERGGTGLPFRDAS